MPGTAHIRKFQCIFCKDPFKIPVGDYDKFKSHMMEIHNIHFDFEVLLAFNFIDGQENSEITKRGAQNIVNKRFYCVFCKDATMVSVQIFTEHMQIVHEMFFQHELLLSNHFIPLREKDDIIKRIKSKAEKFVMTSLGKIWKEEIIEEKPIAPTWPCNNCGKICKSKRKFDRHNEKLCKRCGKCFTLPIYFMKHMRRMEKDPSYDCARPIFRCKQCDWSSRKKEKLDIHFSKKHVEKVINVFNCEDCPKKFFGSRMFQKHLERRRKCKVLPKEDLKCPKCDKYFPNLFRLKGHIDAPTGCYSRISCNKCQKMVLEHNYEIHIEMHERERKVIDMTCKNCLNTFITRSGAKYHYEHIDCKKMIECLKCGRKLKEDKYDYHFSTSCVLEECPKCREKFTKPRLKKHLEMQRSCIDIMCKLCGVPFVFENKLELHMLKKHGETLTVSDEAWKGLPCQFCSKIFVDETSMRKHKYKKHKEMTSDEYCQFCPRLINKNYLIIHLRWKHPTESAAIEKEQRTQCNEIQDNKNNTTTVLDNKCNTCNFTAKNNYGLKVHLSAKPRHNRLQNISNP